MSNITTQFDGTDGATRANFNQKIVDINTHGNDLAAHVTQAKQDKWDAGIVTTYIHTKVGTVHNLSGTGNNIEFLAKAAIADGDTWTVNGTAVTATLQNGEALPADLFKSGSWVTGVRLDGAKLNFKSAGGQTIEVFNFPLTIDTAQPAPIQPGHLWVNHANVSDFTSVVLDDAVKVSYTNGSLMLIVDDTNNGTDNITQYKKVGTSKIPFTSVRDTANDTTLPWQAGSLNKSGNIIDIKRKYPLVYSRLNNVLDLETASIWDGTQWALVSQQGSYLAVGTNNVNGVPSYLYNRIGSLLTIHSGLPSFPTKLVNVVTNAKNGLYTFWGFSATPYGIEYKRVGDIPTVNAFTLHTSELIRNAQYSNDSTKLTLVHSCHIDIYKRVSGVLTYLLTLPLSTSITFSGTDWHPLDSEIIVTGSTTPFVWRFKVTDDTFTQLANPITLPARECYSGKYSPDGNFTVIRTTSSPYTLCFHITSDSIWDKVADTSTIHANTVMDIPVFIPNTNYFIIVDNPSGRLIFHTYNSSEITNIASFALSGARRIAINSQGDKIAVGLSTSPYLKWYSLNGTALTPLTNPTTMPTSTVNALDFLN